MKNYCLLLIFALFAFAKAISQETPVDTTEVKQLEEVILTATRTQRQLSSLPLPVTLISKKKIQQSGSVRLNEILNEQTGIVTVADESGFEGVQIQGMASDYIMILIDGVPLVGRSAGNFDLSRLTVGNIKQIEVVKDHRVVSMGLKRWAALLILLLKNQDLESLMVMRLTA